MTRLPPGWRRRLRRRFCQIVVLGGVGLAALGGEARAAAPSVRHGLDVRTASLTALPTTLLGPASGAVGSLNPITAGAGALANVELNAVSSWILDGANAALNEAAKIIRQTTSPRLESAWFSETYWRVAGLSALLTVPFLAAATIQALLHSDLALLVRAAFGYLPLAMLGITLAAPLVMLMLAATDQMSSVVAAAGPGGGTGFLTHAAGVAGRATSIDGSPFFAVVLGLLTLLAAVALVLEMLIRQAAVYVVVLMLPLAFAALVWPARRVWTVRMVEVLVGLILSKFVIVAVLSMAGAALGSDGGGVVTLLSAMALVMFSAFAPWTLLRLLPLTELAAGAAGALRAEAPRLPLARVAGWGAGATAEAALALPGLIRSRAEASADVGFGGHDAAADAAENEEPHSAETGEAGVASEPEPLTTGAAGAAATRQADEPGDRDRDPGGGHEPGASTGAGAVTDARASTGAGADIGETEPRQRLPGLPDAYQARDDEWPPMAAGSGDWGGPAAYRRPSQPGCTQDDGSDPAGGRGGELGELRPEGQDDPDGAL